VLAATKAARQELELRYQLAERARALVPPPTPSAVTIDAPKPATKRPAHAARNVAVPSRPKAHFWTLPATLAAAPAPAPSAPLRAKRHIDPLASRH
jgi:hypothetical protein